MAERNARRVSILRRNIAAGGPLGIVPALVGTMLFGEFFLPRFAFHFGQRELSLDAIVTLACVAMLAVIGGLRPDPTRIALYCVAMGALLVAAMSNGGSLSGRVSAPSFLLLVCLYSAYIFVIPDASDRTFGSTLRMFRRFSLIVAAAGICQFFAQLAIPGPTLFTFETFFPESVLTQNFNFVIPVPGAEQFNKSNGFFLLEPSHFSQMMALAIIAEIAFRRPSWRLAVLGLALLLSYSGTGLVLCAIFVPLLLVWRGHGQLVVATVGAALALLVFANLIHLTSTLDRLRAFERLRAIPVALLAVHGFRVPTRADNAVRPRAWRDRTLFPVGGVRGARSDLGQAVLRIWTGWNRAVHDLHLPVPVQGRALAPAQCRGVLHLSRSRREPGRRPRGVPDPGSCSVPEQVDHARADRRLRAATAAAPSIPVTSRHAAQPTAVVGRT